MTLFSIYAYDQPLSRHREEASDPENPGERNNQAGSVLARDGESGPLGSVCR